MVVVAVVVAAAAEMADGVGGAGGDDGQGLRPRPCAGVETQSGTPVDGVGCADDC